MAIRGPSIQWRILAWWLPLLAVVFAVVMFWLSTVPKNALYANNLEMVRRWSAETVRAVESSMLNEAGEHPWTRLTREVAAQQGSWVRILGGQGRLVFSNSPDDRPLAADLDDPTCAPCHVGNPDPLPDTGIVPGPGNESYQVLASPLLFRDSCAGCHDSRGSNIGVVLVGLSVEPIHRVVQTIRVGIAIAGIVSLLLALLTMWVVLVRLLGRPLRVLVEGARSCGAGKLEHPIELREKTELSVLADALNLSMSRLKQTVRRVEEQRDEFETLYHFTDQMSRAVRPEERRLRAVELATEFLGSECVLVQAVYNPETETGAGTITLRAGDEFEDQRFRFGPDDRRSVPSFLGGIIERWLKGEFDETARIQESWIVGYPVQHEGRHLGLLLLPVERGVETEASSPDPDLVRALCRHIAIAIEFSEMQNELVAQERLAAIGETIAGLAHCLKNALNALRAGLFITDRALAREDPEKLRRGWGITKVGIRQIEGLSLDMLYYVKQRTPRREPTDPNAVVQEVVDLLREVASERGVTLRTELDAEVGSELLDRTTIYRAILNLVTNALDACTESESGDLVVVRTRAGPHEIVLGVEDNGIGMTDEIRSRLFTRFFSTKAGKGTGLGLAVVKKIVEEHGGTVEVESEPGSGSLFRLRLPRSPRKETGS